MTVMAIFKRPITCFPVYLYPGILHFFLSESCGKRFMFFSFDTLKGTTTVAKNIGFGQQPCSNSGLNCFRGAELRLTQSNFIPTVAMTQPPSNARNPTWAISSRPNTGEACLLCIFGSVALCKPSLWDHVKGQQWHKPRQRHQQFNEMVDDEWVHGHNLC